MSRKFGSPGERIRKSTLPPPRAAFFFQVHRYNAPVNKDQLLTYLEGLDRALERTTTLVIYGSAAFMLLDEPDRTSLDIDVAAPYSSADFGDLRRAAQSAGLPVNPEAGYSGDHIEWIAALRLCLPKPLPETEINLWQGAKLTIKTVPAAALIASKLIRYDEIDQSDIRYLLAQSRTQFREVELAVETLPAPFNTDPLVIENLQNLKSDMEFWGSTA